MLAAEVHAATIHPLHSRVIDAYVGLYQRHILQGDRPELAGRLFQAQLPLLAGIEIDEWSSADIEAIEELIRTIRAVEDSSLQRAWLDRFPVAVLSYAPSTPVYTFAEIDLVAETLGDYDTEGLDRIGQPFSYDMGVAWGGDEELDVKDESDDIDAGRLVAA